MNETKHDEINGILYSRKLKVKIILIIACNLIIKLTYLTFQIIYSLIRFIKCIRRCAFNSTKTETLNFSNTVSKVKNDI